MTTRAPAVLKTQNFFIIIQEDVQNSKVVEVFCKLTVNIALAWEGWVCNNKFSPCTKVEESSAIAAILWSRPSSAR